MRHLYALLFILVLTPGLVHCMRDGKETTVIRDAAPSNVRYTTCNNYARNRIIFAGQTTAVMGVHDRFNRLYYSIQQYPSGQWVDVYGYCTSR